MLSSMATRHHPRRPSVSRDVSAVAVEAQLQEVLQRYQAPASLTVEAIKGWVWAEDGSNEAIGVLLRTCLEQFPPSVPVSDDDPHDLIHALIAAWNVFPHEVLNGKSPQEVRERRAKA